ncbi:hypothetical protein B0H67DRAFT_443622, partial [Lasiosphaeris hirsuta]
DPSIWARAFQKFCESRPELAAYYTEHLDSIGNSAPGEKKAKPSLLQTIDQIVKKLHHHREQKQWKISLVGKDIKIREQAEKFAKFLLWSDPIVKDALSAQPYAALAWSGVSFLLSLLTTGSSQHTAMLDGFDVVNNMIVYWHICEETYLKTPRAHKLENNLVVAVTKLYSLLIEYQARAICHLSQRQLSRAWEKVAGGNEWAERIEQIKVDNERCKSMIDTVREQQIQAKYDEQLRTMQESQIILDKIRQALEESKALSQSHYADQLERTLLHDLASDYEGYKNSNARRVKGTCEWFFQDPRFHKWRDVGDSGVLWVSAGSGCGKSVLSRALIDEGRLSTHVTTSTVCHFFFKQGDERRTSAASALSAIVHQLFTRNSGGSNMMANAICRHRSYGSSLASNFTELWDIIVHYARSPDAGEVVCILDAFDECDEQGRKALLEQFQGFYCLQSSMTDSHTRLKFLVTSRPYDGLELALRKLSKAGKLAHIEGDSMWRQISWEINLVIDDRMSAITAPASIDNSCRDLISDKLKSMEHRTYLWVCLTLDRIEKTPSRFCRARDIEEFFSSLRPRPEVSQAYEGILSGGADRKQTEMLLSIIAAAQRPLTLDEANIALTLALDDTMPASIHDVNPWPHDRFKDVVQSLCGSFVTVSDGELSLFHQTARDFLLVGSNSGSRDGGTWQGCLTLPQSHSSMSRSCLYYLRLLADNTSSNSFAYLDPKEYQTLQQDYPFLSYAAAHWSTHYLAASTTPDSPDKDHALSLCNPAHAHVWAPKHLSRVHFLRWWAWSDLALASYTGLAPVVEDILSHCEKRGTEHGTALRIADARGYAGVVALLLEHGADASRGARGNGHTTPPEVAEVGGHAEVVE